MYFQNLVGLFEISHFPFEILDALRLGRRHQTPNGPPTHLVNTSGVGVAMQMVLTAEPLDAHRALQCNMVTKVVPHEQLMDETEILAAQILRNHSGRFALPRRQSWRSSASPWMTSCGLRGGIPTPASTGTRLADC
jgi:hypothetical protein